MSVRHSNEDLPTQVTAEQRCVVCNKEYDREDKLSSTKCNHTFHTNCVETWLQDNHQCPLCGKMAHTRDLKQYQNSERHRDSQDPRQGATFSSHPHNTRSKTNTSGRRGSQPLTPKPTAQTLPNSSLSAVTYNEIGEFRPEHSNEGARSIRRNAPCRRNNSVNQEQIAQMIDESIRRIIGTLNLSNNVEPRRTGNIRPINNTINSTSRLSSDKITNIIQNWNVKFDGSSKGIRCDEFIYRVTSLTNSTLYGDFPAVCDNLQVLLVGKAIDWYWRYHKQVHRIEWLEFCEALRYQYNDGRSDYDIREELRARKQRVNETFEAFYDSITAITDQLLQPIDEQEFIQIITRNLLPEIRHELLYIPIGTVAQLRKLCQKRENFFKIDLSRKITPRINYVPTSTQRRIAAIESEEQDSDSSPDIQQELNVEEVNKCEKKFICWNCDEEGHSWDFCLKERKIFCYGCGTKNVYKPQCEKCMVKKPKNFQNQSFDRRRTTPH